MPLNPVTKNDTNRPVTAIIVGAGLMGRWHAYYASRAGARINAIIDPDARAAAALAGRHRPARALSSSREMPPLQGTEVWHICTPPDTHAALAAEAIARGAHTLVEKPLTESLVAANDLLQLAGAAGLLMCPVHQFGFQDGVEEALQAIPKRTGEVLQFRFRICTAGADMENEARREAVIDEILPHPLSLLSRLWPDTPLDCRGWQQLRQAPGDRLLTGMHGPVSVLMDISTRARPARAELELAGRHGSLHLDLFHGYCTFQPGPVSRRNKITRPFSTATRGLGAASFNLLRRSFRREPAYPGLRRLLTQFYGAVKGIGPQPITPEQIRAEAEALECLLRDE